MVPYKLIKAIWLDPYFLEILFFQIYYQNLIFFFNKSIKDVLDDKEIGRAQLVVLVK